MRKPFTKNDPRINKAGRPKKKDVFVKLRDTLDLPLSELNNTHRAFVEKYLISRNLKSKSATLGDCLIQRFFDIALDSDDATSLRAISEFFNRTIPNKVDISLAEKGAAEQKFEELTVEQLERIQDIVEEDEEDECYDYCE